MVRREFFKMAAALAGLFSGGRKATATEAPTWTLAGIQQQFDLEDIHKWVDPQAVRVTGPDPDIPAHWMGYLFPDHAVRLRHMPAELARIEPILPRTARILREVTRDVFVIRLAPRNGERSFARVFNCIDPIDRKSKGELYSFLSYSPSPLVMVEEKNRIFLERAPEALSNLYRTIFDGITDVGGDGLRPLHLMETVASAAQAYGEADWYDNFVAKTNPALVYETIVNGAGIAGLIDLNDVSVVKATPIAIWTDAEEPKLKFEDFWEFNDMLLSIVIGATEDSR